MLSIPEWHEIFKVVLAVYFVVFVIAAIIAKWAEFTYKKEHKKVKKVRKASKKATIVYDLGDTSKMTLYEIKQLRNLMEKELRENV